MRTEPPGIRMNSARKTWETEGSVLTGWVAWSTTNKQNVPLLSAGGLVTPSSSARSLGAWGFCTVNVYLISPSWWFLNSRWILAQMFSIIFGGVIHFSQGLQPQTFSYNIPAAWLWYSICCTWLHFVPCCCMLYCFWSIFAHCASWLRFGGVDPHLYRSYDRGLSFSCSSQGSFSQCKPLLLSVESTYRAGACSSVMVPVHQYFWMSRFPKLSVLVPLC